MATPIDTHHNNSTFTSSINMSTLFYNKLWERTQGEINTIIEDETSLEIIRRKVVDDVKVKPDFHTLTIMYMKYLCILEKLDLCYDQMIHVQKRLVIRRLLDGTIGRLLEIRHEMVDTELTEIFSFDKILIKMQLTPENLEVPIPRYFRLERLDELQSRNACIDEIMMKHGMRDVEKDAEDEVTTVEDAVLLIQRMERARQGKLKAHFMQIIHLRLQKEKEQQQREKGGPRQSPSQEPQSEMDPNTAALKIQQIWRGYITWKRIQEERHEEMIFLGMALHVKSTSDVDDIARIRLVEDRRRKIRSGEEQLYRAALNNVKQDILHKEGVIMMDDMKKRVRNWFFTIKERTGKFPDYPTVEQGGFAAIASRTDGRTSGETKKSKSKKARKMSIGPQPSKIAISSSEGHDRKSAFVPSIVNATRDFKDTWESRVTAGAVFEEPIDENLIRAEKRLEVDRELRTQVDALMRQELEHLKIALLKDKGKKGKRLKAALRKQHKKKKKVKTVKKKRKEKDMTAHRSPESLIEELVKKGIIKKSAEVYLKEFLGEPCYVPALASLSPQNADFIETKFSQADVRRFITEYCILPLGCKEAHSKGPLVKSVLIAGPARCGKTMLMNAICTEAGATLFDLTATNLMGKYPGREGLKMLMHLLSKVCRQLQPSVILVEDAEKMFAKKIAKTDKTDPKRIKKGLQKLLKSVSGEDRVLLIGTSRTPFDGEKGLASLYNKIVCVPRPDHASRFVLWRELIDSRGGRLANSVDLSTLTKVSDGYTSGSIAMAIAQTLTPHRVALQKRRALQVAEFIRSLAKYQPVYREEEQSMTEWYFRTPLIVKNIASRQPALKKPPKPNKEEIGKKKKKDSKKKSKR